jgi:putative FmdB family regulatory protein
VTKLPTYEYRCEKCGVFEKIQPISAEPLKNCPKCNGEVKRLISNNVHVVYKVGGFYTTDNRSSDYKSEESKSSDSGSKAS